MNSSSYSQRDPMITDSTSTVPEFVRHSEFAELVRRVRDLEHLFHDYRGLNDRMDLLLDSRLRILESSSRLSDMTNTRNFHGLTNHPSRGRGIGRGRNHRHASSADVAASNRVADQFENSTSDSQSAIVE